MRFLRQWILFIAVQVTCTAFSFAGSFVVQDHIPLSQTVDCDDILVEAAKTLLPTKLDKLVQYYSVVCDPTGTPDREVAIEAIYESHDEESDTALETLFELIAKSTIQGKAQNPIWLRDVFLNIYHYALKQQSGQWVAIDGFEAAQSVEYFSSVYAEKNKLKSFLKNASDKDVETYLFTWLEPKLQSHWKNKVLTEMQKLQLNFHIYLVAQDGRVLKSNLHYQLERVRP